MRLYFSVLRAGLRLARRSDSFLLALLHHNTIGSFALSLPFLGADAGSPALPLLTHNLTVMLEFPFLTLRVRMELLSETKLVGLPQRRIHATTGMYSPACSHTIPRENG